MKIKYCILVWLLILFVCNNLVAQDYTNLSKLRKQATKENYSEIEEKFSKAVKKNKNDANVYFERHQFYYKFHKDDLALQDINKAIELMPEKIIFYQYRADMFFDADSLDAMLLDVNTMMKMDAATPDAHVYKGRYLMKIDSINEAFNSFDKAIQIYESNNAPCFVMSICYSYRAGLNFAYGKLDEAISDFTKAISKVRNTRKDNLLMSRAKVFLAKTDTKNAYQDIGAAFVYKADTMTLAYLYALKSDQEKLNDIIIGIVAKKLKTNYREAVKLYNVACLYAIVNQKEKALEFLEKSLQLGYSNFNWIQVDYDMKNIKDLPAFSDLIQKYQTKQK
jgi:tetratricopeptide (TPR) repeat protein